MDVRTPGSFGGHPSATPRIDQLAAEGMRFHRAHVPAAVCQPSRSAMLTGRWPHRNGAEGFEPIHDGVPLLTEVLASVGYVSGILGKVNHLEPVERFGWTTSVGMRELGMGRDPSAYGREARRFFDAAAERGAPWFLMANAHDPHRPFHGTAQERTKWTEQERAAYPDPSQTFDPADEAVVVPGFLPDLPAVRGEVAAYLASSRRCDDVVGAVLDALDAAGQADDTIVVFLSDNGVALPFAKANCYLRSTLTPLIVRWPGHVTAGSSDGRHFVSMIDLFPLFADVAGAGTVEGIDGRNPLPLLGGGRQSGRDRVFTVFHETSAKLRLEMRCVQDERFGYIWNAWSDGVTEYRAENMEGETWPAMVEAASAGGPLAERVRHYLRRAPEELYDLERDPDCLTNLAADARFAPALERCRGELRDWMASTADPLAEAYVTARAAPTASASRPEPPSA